MKKTNYEENLENGIILEKIKGKRISYDLMSFETYSEAAAYIINKAIPINKFCPVILDICRKDCYCYHLPRPIKHTNTSLDDIKEAHYSITYYVVPIKPQAYCIEVSLNESKKNIKRS